MAVIKLNDKEIMAKNKRKKPTTQDFINIINSLIQDVHSLQNDMNAVMGAFDMYVDFNKHSTVFKDYIDTKIDNTGQGKDELQATGQDNTVATKTDSSN